MAPLSTFLVISSNPRYPSLSTGSSLPPKPLPALLAMPAKHALIALPSLPAPAIPGPRSLNSIAGRRPRQLPRQGSPPASAVPSTGSPGFGDRSSDAPLGPSGPPSSPGARRRLPTAPGVQDQRSSVTPKAASCSAEEQALQADAPSTDGEFAVRISIFPAARTGAAPFEAASIAHAASCVGLDHPPTPAARIWFTAIATPAAAAAPATTSPAIHLISRASRACRSAFISPRSAFPPTLPPECPPPPLPRRSIRVSAWRPLSRSCRLQLIQGGSNGRSYGHDLSS